MIIANGTIEYKVKKGGGIDPFTGNPVKATYEWSTPIECQIVPITVSYLGKTSADGSFTRASYKVLIDKVNSFTSEEVRINSFDGMIENKGFSVISFTPLDAVDEVSIYV